MADTTMGRWRLLFFSKILWLSTGIAQSEQHNSLYLTLQYNSLMYMCISVPRRHCNTIHLCIHVYLFRVDMEKCCMVITATHSKCQLSYRHFYLTSNYSLTFISTQVSSSSSSSPNDNKLEFFTSFEEDFFLDLSDLGFFPLLVCNSDLVSLCRFFGFLNFIIPSASKPLSSSINNKANIHG